MAKAKKAKRSGKSKGLKTGRNAASKVKKRGPGIKQPNGTLKPAGAAPALKPMAAPAGGLAIKQPDGGLIRAAAPAGPDDDRPAIKQPDVGL
jgi:hypothetical protein